MSLRNNIINTLGILHKAITQAPLDKQPMLMKKLQRVVERYQGQNQNTQPAYLKQLQFNLNFLKLSFPKLDYSPPQEPQNPNSNPNPNEKKEQEQLNQKRAKEQFVQLQNQEQVLKFVEDTEKVLKGVREQVQFMNWSAGNFDPEDLKRHKQLMARQYFSGEFWKGKEKPISPTASYLMDLMENHPEERQKQVVVEDKQEQVKFTHDSQNNWQKVKR